MNSNNQDNFFDNSNLRINPQDQYMDDYSSSDCERDLEEIQKFYGSVGRNTTIENNFSFNKNGNPINLNFNSNIIEDDIFDKQKTSTSKPNYMSKIRDYHDKSNSKAYQYSQYSNLSEDEDWETSDIRQLWNNNSHKYLRNTQAYTSDIRGDEHHDVDPVYINDTKGLVSVNEISTGFVSVFGFNYFNKMQSECFDVIYKTDNNICISSPTSSGKTVIFKLAMIRVWESDLNRKCIYIAPTKSLCQQKVREFSSSFIRCRKKAIVKEVTGDTQELSISDMLNADVIVTTPEKFDSVTRGWSSSKSIDSFVKNIRLVCIDEVHFLNESRGHTLEALVSRLKSIASINQQDMRVVAVSATIPNLNDIGDWLGCNPNHRFSFGDEYRPVPLDTHIFGYPQTENQNSYIFQRNMSHKILDLILQFSERKPTLIFCSTRKDTSSTVDIILKEAEERKISFIYDRMTQSILNSASSRISNSILKRQIKLGCAHHCAGLSTSDRSIVEELFYQGHLKLLCSTTTLALGVNLPARLVIVKGTQSYIQGSGYLEYDILTILQMLGRAGRPQFDTRGCAIIMTSTENIDLYNLLVKNQMEIESCFQNHIISHLNSEILCKSVCNIDQALKWIKSTFYFIRMLRNPGRYGIIKKDVDNYLQETISKNISLLLKEKLITDFNGTYRSTELGAAMSKYYISINTMQNLSTITKEVTFEDIFIILCKSFEFEEFPFRRGEKKILNNLNKDKETVLYKCKGKITSIHQKISLLIQAGFVDYKFENDREIANQIPMIMKIAPRIVRCMKSVAIHKNLFNALKHCCELEKCIKHKVWPNSQYLTKQLPGIGKVFSEKLGKSGIHTIQDVAKSNVFELERILGRQKIGAEILKKAKMIPNFDIVTSLDEKEDYIDLQVKFIKADDCIENNLSSSENYFLILIGNIEGELLLSKRINGKSVKQFSKVSIKLDKFKTENYKITIGIQSENYVGFEKFEIITIPGIEIHNKPIKKNIQKQIEDSPLEIVIGKAKSQKKRKIEDSLIQQTPIKRMKTNNNKNENQEDQITPQKELQFISNQTTPQVENNNQFSFPNSYTLSQDQYKTSHDSMREKLEKDLDEEMNWCNDLLDELSAEINEN